MEEKTYVETDSEWKQGAALDYYNQEISIVAANEGKDGKIYMKWVYSQTKERKASEKTIPLKITLGNTGTAINILEGWIKTLRGPATTTTKAPPQGEAAPFNREPEEDIPF